MSDRADPPHRIVNPDSLLPPVGFAHAVVAAPGRTVHLGGQTGHRRDGSLDDGLVAQFDQALANLAVVLSASGAVATDLVSIHVYTTDIDSYRAAGAALGEVWRRHLGRHYPAIAVFGIGALYDPRAVVEVVAQAVLPPAPPGAIAT
jgi:enamine deaminase RidA (YjgF/YER057c/UK114 family)